MSAPGKVAALQSAFCSSIDHARPMLQVKHKPAARVQSRCTRCPLVRRCGVCQIGVKGEKEAVEHAKATGHQNFSEYH